MSTKNSERVFSDEQNIYKQTTYDQNIDNTTTTTSTNNKNNKYDFGKQFMKTYNDLKELLKKSDLAILDREFKDCLSTLKSRYGLNCKTQTCMKN
ncbi:unnamed protein product [Brachionus calyciflorus]|uniref:Uncharacterized protein n=1 Tax=Brachionus calyciflorus TaxID=104777 RepID=A0A813QZ17_9BILA|nr:unnamed protein product [Brachionus calyciflorus]